MALSSISPKIGAGVLVACLLASQAAVAQTGPFAGDDLSAGVLPNVRPNVWPAVNPNVNPGLFPGPAGPLPQEAPPVPVGAYPPPVYPVAPPCPLVIKVGKGLSRRVPTRIVYGRRFCF